MSKMLYGKIKNDRNSVAIHNAVRDSINGISVYNRYVTAATASTF